MANPIGVDAVTSIARRYIMPEVTEVVYQSNPVFYRMYSSNRKMVQGGTHIEAPFMYDEIKTGGFYEGYDLLDTSPADTMKNGAWDWKQAYVNVTIDGLTLIKVDSPESIANFLRIYFQQAEMQLCEILATGLWSAGGGKLIDGLAIAVAPDGVYGGLDRTTNAWLGAQQDAATATLDLDSLQAHFGTCQRGGHTPSLLVSRQEQYNRYYKLHTAAQRFPVQPSGADQQLASGGFSNLLFNGIPWTVDSHVPDGPDANNSAIYFLNEDFINLCVSPRADFWLEDFITPSNQDASVAKILWAGNLVVTNPARQGRMTAVAA